MMRRNNIISLSQESSVPYGQCYGKCIIYYVHDLFEVVVHFINNIVTYRIILIFFTSIIHISILSIDFYIVAKVEKICHLIKKKYAHAWVKYFF